MGTAEGVPPEAYAEISTHVLDTTRGEPARGVYVRLERRDADGWSPVCDGRTDADGRLRGWVPLREWQVGGYRLIFYVEPYLGGDAFFPEIVVGFHVRDPHRPYHIPLLLSPYGYTTYRGS